MVRPDNDEKFVYDLIVEPDSTGRFEYIAGAENALFVVAFELSTINNCTKAEQQAFEIIMAMITTSAKKLDALYKSTDHVDFLKKMKDIIQQIKGSIISIAIDYETGDNYSSAMSEGKSLSELVSTATTLFQSEEGTYSQACGVAFDYLMQEVFSQIASSLELGFRVIPESDTLDTLVLSVLDFYVIDSAPKIPSNPIIIVHFPDQEPLNEEGEHKGSEFGRRFHKMFHFSIKEDVSHDIIIELFSSTDKKVLLTANLFLQPNLSYGCLNQRLPLYDELKVEQGYINVDTRILNKDHIENENSLALTWNEEHQKNLSQRLLKLGGYLLAHFVEESQQTLELLN